jgi:hypothetical protein
MSGRDHADRRRRGDPPRRLALPVVIYCVVPEPLADELYDKLVAYYADDPDVKVIVDRRKQERRKPGHRSGGAREVRDRRRRRTAGDYPALVEEG